MSKYQANLVKSLQSDLKVADSFIAALLTVVEIENPMFGILHAWFSSISFLPLPSQKIGNSILRELDQLKLEVST